MRADGTTKRGTYEETGLPEGGEALERATGDIGSLAYVRALLSDPEMLLSYGLMAKEVVGSLAKGEAPGLMASFLLVTGAKGGKGKSGKVVPTSRAARRQAMRDAGIPTSQQPIGQRSVTTYSLAGEVKVGRQFDYEVPGFGGTSQKMSVQHSLTDDVPRHGPHWEAGRIKEGGQVDSVGRPRLKNDKAKVEE